MILGTGIDLVDIRRIERSLKLFGERFEKKIFTKKEREYANSRANMKAIASAYAKRFAAKEACAKALTTGFGQGVSWRDFEVVKTISGGVSLQVSGVAFERLNQLIPINMKPQIFLSLTDEYPYAQAQVIISAINISYENE